MFVHNFLCPLTPPPPNQQREGFPLDFLLKVPQQNCEHSAKIANKPSKNCEQTELWTNGRCWEEDEEEKQDETKWWKRKKCKRKNQNLWDKHYKLCLINNTKSLCFYRTTEHWQIKRHRLPTSVHEGEAWLSEAWLSRKWRCRISSNNLRGQAAHSIRCQDPQTTTHLRRVHIRFDTPFWVFPGIQGWWAFKSGSWLKYLGGGQTCNN